VEMRFLLQISDLSAVERTLRNLHDVDSVFEARRMVPGQGGHKAKK